MKYLYYIRTSFLELLEYRTNIFIRGINYAVSLTFNLFFWLAVTRIRGEIFHYSTSDIVLYYIFLALIIPLVNAGADFSQKIGHDIKYGDLNTILIKPIRPIAYYSVYALSQRLRDFLMLAPFTFGILIIFNYHPHFSLLQILIWVIGIIFAFVLSHLILGLVGLIAFWSTENNWASNFFMQVITLLSGTYFPLSFFSAPILSLIFCTPFYFLIYFPTSVILGKDPASVYTLLVPIFWTSVLFLAVIKIWSLGLRRFEGVGI